MLENQAPLQAPRGAYTTPQSSLPTPPLEPANKQPKRENIRSILSTVSILLIAPLIAVLLTAFVFQSYQVDGPSMETTLYNNDRLIVWKVSKTWSRLTGNPYIPDRGDIVVFTEPNLAQYGQEPSKQLIKRVIGLPGERIVVRDNTMTIYNQEYPEGFQPDEELPYGQIIKKDTNIDGEWTIGEHEVFVVGDNRYNSLDSRIFGPIHAHNIVGKLALRVLPLNHMERF